MNVDEIERVYSAYSGFYDLIFGKLFDRARIHALSRLAIKPGDRILEVGVGTGLSLPLYPRHCQIVGIDLTGPMLDKGRERVRKYGLSHVELQRMDATRMQFPDASFDAVFAAYVITAVPQPKQVLAEMVRVCRPGGRIVLLNHFSNGNPFISKVERTLSPLCSRIGFRSDLSLEELFDGTDLVVTRKEKVPPLNYWRIIECINRGSASPGDDRAISAAPPARPNGTSPAGHPVERPH
jgi:phosphatidylethanolamine/phosphatidyl-N-methylethanolamine N-methyltransferase